ncbi:hypothetical protein [Sphingomonas endolithica]|nr:hypothetical protein [Sphingomonas sp. ZFBP2030]
MTNHVEQTLPHDLAGFEGDWLLLIQEEELEHTLVLPPGQQLGS